MPYYNLKLRTSQYTEEIKQLINQEYSSKSDDDNDEICNIVFNFKIIKEGSIFGIYEKKY